MAYNEFQKITLHTTSNLAKDQEIIDYEKDAVQKIMMENHIKFSIEIEEMSTISSSLKHTGSAYALNLIVAKYDLDKVIELLDKEGGFGYYIDLDEEYDPNEDVEEKETESDDPIKTYGEKDENVFVESETDEFEKAEFENSIYLILRVFVVAVGGIILLFALGMFIVGIEEKNYEMVTASFIIMVVGTPMIIVFYNLLKKK